MPNILIFPCGSEIGLEIYRSLSHNPCFQLLGASTYPDHGRFVYPHYVETVPHFDDPAFIDAIKQLTMQHQIDFILPAHDGALLRLAEGQEQFTAEVVTSSLATCQITRSKLKTYQYFEGKFAVPQIFQPEDIDTFPVFLKPEVGQGSRGTQIAHSPDEVKFYLERNPSLMILQYLPGEEATVDCFTDHQGVLQYVQGRKRNRIRNGISVNSSQINDPEIEDLAKIINTCLELRGAWFFQIKKDEEGRWCLMEIAPRIASTSCVPRIAGVNLVEWSIRDRLHEKWTPTPHGYLVATDRALYSRYRLDMDYDAILIHGISQLKENNPNLPEIMRMLFHVKVRNIPLIALSADTHELVASLKMLAIDPNLFEGSYTIEEVHTKLNPFKCPILIDLADSSISKSVRKLNIPIFGIDMLDAFV